tara:strand:+ start:775 stop:1137 length:363 start_codon:yes stop_codon:yes gene_type:complete
MYRICVSTSFNAMHAVTIQGVDETPHSHDWKVSVTLTGPELDNDGLLMDFVEVEQILERIVAPLRNSDLNKSEAFKKTNPSAERIAHYIGEAMRLETPSPIQVQSISITEAPNCKVIYTL